MEVHQLLTHMKDFFKSSTQYGLRVSCSKDAIQNDFNVNTETFQGKVLIIVIPGKADFQIVVMTVLMKMCGTVFTVDIKYLRDA